MENELEIKIDDEFAKKVYDEIWAEYEKTAQTKTFAKITLTENELKITDSKVMGLPYIPKGAEIHIVLSFSIRKEKGRLCSFLPSL